MREEEEARTGKEDIVGDANNTILVKKDGYSLVGGGSNDSSSSIRTFSNITKSINGTGITKIQRYQSTIVPKESLQKRTDLKSTKRTTVS